MLTRSAVYLYISYEEQGELFTCIIPWCSMVLLEHPSCADEECCRSLGTKYWFDIVDIL